MAHFLWLFLCLHNKVVESCGRCVPLGTELKGRNPSESSTGGPPQRCEVRQSRDTPKGVPRLGGSWVHDWSNCWYLLIHGVFLMVLVSAWLFHVFFHVLFPWSLHGFLFFSVPCFVLVFLQHELFIWLLAWLVGRLVGGYRSQTHSLLEMILEEDPRTNHTSTDQPEWDRLAP